MSYKPGVAGLALTVHAGQDLLIRVFNDTGSTITKGEAVYFSGASNGVATAAPAIANSLITSQVDQKP